MCVFKEARSRKPYTRQEITLWKSREWRFSKRGRVAVGVSAAGPTPRGLGPGLTLRNPAGGHAVGGPPRPPSSQDAVTPDRVAANGWQLPRVSEHGGSWALRAPTSVAQTAPFLQFRRVGEAKEHLPDAAQHREVVVSPEEVRCSERCLQEAAGLWGFC